MSKKGKKNFWEKSSSLIITGSAVLIIVLIVMRLFSEEEKESLHPEYGIEEFEAGIPLPDDHRDVCEVWKEKYIEIPKRDTLFTIHRGQRFFLDLDPMWSRPIKFSKENFRLSGRTEIKLPTNEVLVTSPGKTYLNLWNYNILQFRGDGCMIIYPRR